MATTPSDRPSAFPWPPVLFAVILAASAVYEFYLLATPLIAENTVTDIAGLMVCVGAIYLFWLGTNELKSHETSIRPDRSAAVLVTSGPFQWSRNPIYLSDTIFLAGLGLFASMATLFLGAVIFALLVHWLAILPEEAHLERQFGDAYRTYKARVRRWL